MGALTGGDDRNLRSVLEHAPVLAWIVGPDAGCTYVNAAWLAITGRRLEQELGDGWLENLHVDDREAALATFLTAFEAREPFRMEFRIHDSAGESRNILDFGGPLYSEAGEFRGYLGFCVDVTEPKQAEQGARAAQQLYESFLDGLCAHVAVLDEDTNIIFVNESWRRFAEACGFEAPDAGLGMNYLMVCHSADGPHAEEAPRVAEGIRQVIEGRIPRFEIEYPCHDSGEERWFILRISRLEGPGPGVALTQHTDVTSLRQAEEERALLQAKMQQVQRLESLGVLAGGIAHDFNNLLTVILGNTRMLLEDLPEGSPLRKRTARVRTAAENAARLTDQMLTYAGEGHVSLQPSDLSTLVSEMQDLLQASQNGRGVLELRLADVPPVLADATQMRQVILNLVTNAFEALDSAAGSVRVTTGRCQADSDYLVDCFGNPEPEAGEWVFLEVSDTGPGVEAEEQCRLFEPFFTTKFSGRGLGLASVLGIVKAHGGVIKLESAPGCGTSFRVLLPPTERPAPPSPGRDRPSGPRRAAARVLVVDDEEWVREITAEFLRRADFEVVVAEGGRKAIEILRADPDAVDGVVLDLAMPDVNGEEAFRALRAIRPELPILLVSGYSEEMAQRRFEPRGHAGFLQKPFEARDLVSMLSRALERRG